ncbi:helix-turn-helix domain-containing protein [Breoghania sp. JC706]|uniref:helix-turn-helix domain-containing protein n=1 Tax=Breoghania sp. JC706 TaxID=3117732 RepID=UPI00300BF750
MRDQQTENPETTLANVRGPERRAYSVAEFSAMFGFSRKHAYDLRKQGQVHFKKIGAKTVILIDEIRRFEASLEDA